MPNTITTTNLIMGPADLYKGLFGATEPTDSAVNTAPPASAWTGVGGTNDGVNLTLAQNYEELEVDQIVDVVGRRLTKREFTLETNLAEPTLENLATSLNESTPTSGAGFKYLEPTTENSATQPTYYALILDGYSPNSLRRRIIGRKMLSTDDVESSYAKGDQTFLKVTFSGHYVSSSIKPFRVVDQTS